MIKVVNGYEVWTADYNELQPKTLRNLRYLKLDEILSPWWANTLKECLRIYSAPEGPYYWEKLNYRCRVVTYEDLEKIYMIFDLPPMKPVTKEDIV